jgi:phosphate transport system substrate-binding protein
MINSFDFKLVSVALVFIALIATSSGIAASPIVRTDGSSTVYPITEAVAEDFQIANRGKIRVTVGISGTGGGFRKFCRNEIDIVNASRPITALEMKACKSTGVQFIEMPIALDALTIVVNPRNTWSREITVAELKKIWEPAAQRKILFWNQINPAWPDKKITLFGPGSDSGTFEYFTEAIVGKARSSRGDFSASEDDNVLVQGVANNIYALGFFGFAYYSENRKKIQVVAVDSGNGGVIPSAQTVKDSSYNPLARPIFIYINAKSISRPEIKEFVTFYMNNASALVEEVKFFPLSASVYKLNLKHFSEMRVGSVFSGKVELGIEIEEILRREPRL